MHRSITLTEMLSSTFSTDRYDVRDNKSKKQFVARIGIGLVEVSFWSISSCLYYW